MADALHPTIDRWGFFDIDAEYYHTDPAPRPSLSSGCLATIISQTVAAAKESHPRLGPPSEREDNKRFDLGTVAHTLVLGVGRPIDVIDADAWTTKAAKEARAESIAAGRSPVLAKVHDQAMAMRTALFHQLADMPEEHDTFLPDVGAAEQAGFWQEQTPLGKMWGRALYDWRSTGTGRVVIRDYKTYGGQHGADPEGFIRGLISSGRDVQDPWYSRGAAAIVGQQTGEALTWEDVDFKFIVQDPDPPYLAVVVALDDRRWSFERSQWALDRWAAAAGAGIWRGFTPVTHHVPVPAYARIAWEDRMVREFETEQALQQAGRPALALKDPEAYRVPNPNDIDAGIDAEPEQVAA